MPTALVASDHQHRRRLLEGMAQAVAAKGYAETTIADVVRGASVSRRTFYEHFDTKSQCFIALYEAASHQALVVLQQSIDPSHEWQAQVERGLEAYLGCMAANPVLLRTLFIEILGLGAEGLAARRRVNQEIADFIVQAVQGAVTPQLANAIVGGINELVLQYIEQDRVEQLLELVGPGSALIRAVTHAEE